jgi:D-glucosaminate-6-phosphate ammonia-lyase
MGMYERLGVRRVINATCHHTVYGGSVMWPEVLDAMADARRACVDVRQLLDAASAFISHYTHAEASYVASGCAACLQVGAAAIMAGADKVKMEALPHTADPALGIKHEFVARRFPRQRTAGGAEYVHWGYAHAVRGAGGTFREVGGRDGVTREEFVAALGPQTAGVYWVSDGVEPGLQLTDVIALAHAQGVPVLVDASNTLPPAEHLHSFIDDGADLVAFSGGKGLRGPQASGLVLGKAHLIAACRLNQNPHSSIGRGMKVGKEEICGLIKAVEVYVARDLAADLRYWDACAQTILHAAQDLEGVTAERFLARTIPQAKLTLDALRAGISAAELSARLAEGDPSVRAGLAGNTLTFNPHNLEPGEAEHIAARLTAILQAAARRPAALTV